MISLPILKVIASAMPIPRPAWSCALPAHSTTNIIKVNQVYYLAL